MNDFATRTNVAALAAAFGRDQGDQDDRIGLINAKATDAQRALSAPYQPFTSRAASEAATIPSTVSQINVDGLTYVLDPAGTALTTADGKKWSPMGDVTPMHWGIAQNVDETARLEAMALWAAQHGRAVIWPDGEYQFQRLAITGSDLSVDWRGTGGCILRSLASAPLGPNWDDDYAIKIAGRYIGPQRLAASGDMGGDTLTVTDTSPYKPGQVLSIRTTRMIDADNRGQAREGQVALLDSVVSGTELRIRDQFMVRLEANWVRAGEIQAVASGREMTFPVTFDRPERDMLLRVAMTSGAQSGQARYITKWDNATKTATFGGRQPEWGAGIAPGDTFTVEWATDIIRNDPVRVSISGIHLTREQHIGASPGDLGFRGLEVLWAVEPHISMTISGFSETGVSLRECYGGQFTGHISGANRAYASYGNPSDGTGYGISIYQCWRTQGVGITTRGCRRGGDIGGAQEQAWFCEFRDCQAVGGGVSYEGVAFWPRGDAYNSGWGSHGSGYASRYINCEALNTFNGFSCRSRDEEILDCRQRGYAYNCVHLYHGGGLRVDGFRYADGFSEIGRGAADRHAVSGHPQNRAQMFMEFQTSTYMKHLPVIVRNVDLMKVSRAVFGFQDGATEVPSNLSFGNIRAYASPEGVSGLNQFTFIRNFGSAKQVLGLNDMGGNSYTFDGVEYTAFNMLDFATGNASLVPGTFMDLGWPKQILVSVEDDAVVKIPVGRAGVALVSMFDYRADRNWRATDMLLYANRAVDYSPLQASSKVGITLSTSALTGTTGADGAMTIAFRPANAPYFHIENRTGGTAVIVVQMSMLA